MTLNCRCALARSGSSSIACRNAVSASPQPSPPLQQIAEIVVRPAFRRARLRDARPPSLPPACPVRPKSHSIADALRQAGARARSLAETQPQPRLAFPTFAADCRDGGEPGIPGRAFDCAARGRHRLLALVLLRHRSDSIACALRQVWIELERSPKCCLGLGLVIPTFAADCRDCAEAPASPGGHSIERRAASIASSRLSCCAKITLNCLCAPPSSGLSSSARRCAASASASDPHLCSRLPRLC